MRAKADAARGAQPRRRRDLGRPRARLGRRPRGDGRRGRGRLQGVRVPERLGRLPAGRRRVARGRLRDRGRVRPPGRRALRAARTSGPDPSRRSRPCAGPRGIAAEHGARLHVVHASAVEAVDEARRWPGVTIETCPHYLAITDDEADAIGARARCNPPIRDAANQRGALGAAASRARSTGSRRTTRPARPNCATAPHPWAGISGVELTIPVLLDAGLDPVTVAAPDHRGRARRCAFRARARIAVGADADLVARRSRRDVDRRRRRAARPPPRDAARRPHAARPGAAHLGARPQRLRPRAPTRCATPAAPKSSNRRDSAATRRRSRRFECVRRRFWGRRWLGRCRRWC